MHDVLVGDVRVGEDDFVDHVPFDQVSELGFGMDRNSGGIEVTGERCRVDPALDVGNLRRREGDDLVFGPAAVDDVEVVEVPPRGPGDQDASSHE
jgi:hypothetical protein